MIEVQDYDHAFTIDRTDFDPIFTGDKLAHVVSDYELGIEVGNILQFRERGTGRICEVEITHVAPLFSGLKLLSLDLC